MIGRAGVQFGNACSVCVRLDRTRDDLRGKVRVQTDGGLKTGLDVIKAAIMGAESFGFGTAPMVALGCKYLRICHLNNCATGVATQNSVLRSKHFIGLPDMVMNYFKFVARAFVERDGFVLGGELVRRADVSRRTSLMFCQPRRPSGRAIGIRPMKMTIISPAFAAESEQETHETVGAAGRHGRRSNDRDPADGIRRDGDAHG